MAVKTRLAVENEVLLASVAVQLHTILAVARCDTTAEAAKLIRSNCNSVGGSLRDGHFCADNKGVHWTDQGVMIHPDSRAIASVSWSRVVELIHLGLTPGLLAAGSDAYRRYGDLHDEPWEIDRHGCFGWMGCREADNGWHGTNAVSDPLAYSLIWWPEYIRTTRLMHDVERAVWGNAVAAVCKTSARLTLSV